VARSIREKPGGKNTLIIAQTGWGQDKDRQRTREAGCDAHLTKPLDYDVLMRLLSQSTRKAQIVGT
jgi:CheY-like chemotaxis protein